MNAKFTQKCLLRGLRLLLTETPLSTQVTLEGESGFSFQNLLLPFPSSNPIPLHA